jgi:uncharacterized repeat protein (TIGR03803 family)
MAKHKVWKRTLSVLILCVASSIAASSQTFQDLVFFNGPNGSDPFAPLVQGLDGNLYGATVYGGANNYGTIFKMSSSGQFTMLYSFCAQASCPDGNYPDGLTLATDKNFYGATYGNNNNPGTIFRFTPSGKLTTLYTFCSKPNCADGVLPQAILFQATDGNLYGTTNVGGTHGQGTIFKISLSGKLTTLYSFCAQTNCADGAQPYTGLIQASDGNFYGTTAFGGNSTNVCVSQVPGCGVVYKITPAGKLTILYNFCTQANCADGSIPQGRLLQATDGNFYSTTDGGGPNDAGTIYKITPSGKLTTLHTFCVSTCTDGGIPYAGLIQATDGNFYGTAVIGGPKGYGVVFQLTPSGRFTTLHGFDDNDGSSPAAELMQTTDGNFYGSTQQGVLACCNHPFDGTVFRVGMGLSPFVETLPSFGKVGAKVTILGTDLTGTTSVTFNSTPATFTVVSASEIIATVPTDATTGKVEVTTPQGNLASNLSFRVE